MIKDIDPMAFGLAGFLLLGGAFAYSNPNTRAMFSQRNMAQQLQQAADMESQATRAMKVISAARRENCTPVAQINPTAVYQLPVNTTICDGSTTAVIGKGGRPALLSQEVSQ